MNLRIALPDLRSSPVNRMTRRTATAFGCLTVMPPRTGMQPVIRSR